MEEGICFTTNHCSPNSFPHLWDHLSPNTAPGVVELHYVHYDEMFLNDTFYCNSTQEQCEVETQQRCWMMSHQRTLSFCPMLFGWFGQKKCLIYDGGDVGAISPNSNLEPTRKTESEWLKRLEINLKIIFWVLFNWFLFSALYHLTFVRQPQKLDIYHFSVFIYFNESWASHAITWF